MKTRTQLGECVEAKALVPDRTYAFTYLGFCVWGLARCWALQATATLARSGTGGKAPATPRRRVAKIAPWGRTAVGCQASARSLIEGHLARLGAA